MLNGIYYSNYSSSSTSYDVPSIFNGYMSLLFIHSDGSILNHGIETLEYNTIKNILNLFDITKEKIGLKEDNVKIIKDISNILDEKFNLDELEIFNIYDEFKKIFYYKIIKKEEQRIKDKTSVLNLLEDSINEKFPFITEKQNTIKYTNLKICIDIGKTLEYMELNINSQNNCNSISNSLYKDMLNNFINNKNNITLVNQGLLNEIDLSNYNSYMKNNPLTDKLLTEKLNYKGLFYLPIVNSITYDNSDAFIYNSNKLNCYFDLESLDIKYEELSYEEITVKIENVEKFKDNYIYKYDCVDLLLNYDDLYNLIKLKYIKINVSIDFYYEDNENIGIIII